MKYKSSLAIVSKNKSKYSETFIHSHVQHLANEVHYLYDGYLPEKYSIDKGSSERSFLSFLERRGKSLGRRKRLKRSIEHYLRHHSIQVVLAEYGPSGVEMMDICNRLNIPLFVHFHGYDAYRLDVLSSYGKEYPRLFESAEGVIVVSGHMSRQLEKLGCPPSKIHLIPYGVDTTIFRPVEVGTKYTFVNCARFVAKKGHRYIIEAFYQLWQDAPHLQLLFIGDGPLKMEIEQKVTDLGMEGNVTFAGVLEPVEIANSLNASLCYVQHSITSDSGDSEGLPLTLLEAGACKRPVIASAHAGILELIEEGQTGYLAEEKNVEGLLDRMKMVLDRPGESEQCANRLHQRILAKHTLQGYIGSLQKSLNLALHP